MNLLFWGLTISVIGKIILGIAVLRVHSGIVHEHKIDGVVLRAMKREKWVTIIGLSLIVIGYIMEILFYGFTPFMDFGFGAEPQPPSPANKGAIKRGQTL